MTPAEQKLFRSLAAKAYDDSPSLACRYPIGFALKVATAFLAAVDAERAKQGAVAWACWIDEDTEQRPQDAQLCHYQPIAYKNRAPLYLSPRVPDGWKPLTDTQWLNIVNHGNGFADKDKESAVNLAVKLTEARLKMNNAAAPTPEDGK